MNRYWVLFNDNWEIDTVEFKGTPSNPPTEEGIVCEPGPQGKVLLRTEHMSRANVEQVRGKAFDVVLDAQDELAAMARALVLVGRMKEVGDGL